MILRKRITFLLMAAALFFGGCKSEPAPAQGTSSGTEERVLETNETEKEDLSSFDEESSENGEPAQDGSREPMEKALLSIDKVLELTKQEGLSWTDLEEYACEDVGSGVMALCYGIDKDFCLVAGGSGYDQEPMYIRLVSREDDSYIDIRDGSYDQVRDFLNTHGSSKEYVGIRGHVKELHGDQALISSDTDDFPGVFQILGVSEAGGDEELKGGSPVFVVMEDIGRTEESVYKANAIFLVSEEEKAKADVLLTSPPALELADPLSSSYNRFQVLPVNETVSIPQLSWGNNRCKWR